MADSLLNSKYNITQLFQNNGIGSILNQSQTFSDDIKKYTTLVFCPAGNNVREITMFPVSVFTASTSMTLGINAGSGDWYVNMQYIDNTHFKITGKGNSLTQLVVYGIK